MENINKLNYIRNQADMLEGNINRIFVTDELEELERMYHFAQLRLDEIYEFHKDRLENVTKEKKR